VKGQGDCSIKRVVGEHHIAVDRQAGQVVQKKVESSTAFDGEVG
jgi:hypothetical protein